MEAATASLESPGAMIAARYVVDDVIGRGGMAAVYRVRDARSGRALALKRGVSSDPRRAEKRKALLEREYYTLAQLAHPRIIEVYEYGVDERGPYYTMELLDGVDLDASGKLPWREACAVLRDVASSLAILHSRGLLHRDVSARNVRRTADGRVKLIDFGAMASMGSVKDVVGTPPFVAPEALQLQALDARADLFSLGALAYFLLTGRHAYPARKMSELRDVWRSKPMPPARFASDLPGALGALVMQLLMLDRAGRPESAAEVMSRLCAIAGLPVEESADVSHAYLSTPTLVGRDRELIAVRRGLLSLARGDGGTLLIEGAPGTGRSRLLDACVLEGKLLGAAVVRAGASDAAGGEWSVARALGNQLFALMPEEAAIAARLSRDVLGHVIDAARPEPNVPFSTARTEVDRSLIIRELREFVLSLVRVQRLMIAVDDADRIDEPSLALLAALAMKAERSPLVLALAVDRDSRYTGPTALTFLCSLGTKLTTEPLSRADTEALMRSVFGDVPNLTLLAERVFALSQGNPGAAMELAQHIVQRGLARYEAGLWSLPAELDGSDLPVTMAASVAERLARLSGDARELCEALSLAEGEGLALPDYPALTSHRDPRRVFAALDELVAARVLVADADRYAFQQRACLELLREAVPAERRAAVHARIAGLLASVGGDVLRRAHHLFECGQDREAIALLCSVDLYARLPPLPLLERAVERAERLHVPTRTLYQLRHALLSKATLVGAVEAFRRCAPQVLQQLEHDSGLARYRELSSVPEGERLSRALADAQERYRAAPEDERVYGVSEAIRELGRLAGAFCSIAVPIYDLDILDWLPSFEPFKPLSSAMGLIEDLVEAAKAWICGRIEHSAERYDRALARILEPDRAGLDDAQYARTRVGLAFVLGLHEAVLGSAAAERYAEMLDGHPDTRVNALRVRHIAQLVQGKVADAGKSLRRAELLQLQRGSEERYMGSAAGHVLVVQARAGDLLGLKSTLEIVAARAERHLAWRPLGLYGQALVRQLQGDGQGALELLLSALELTAPGKHTFYGHLATSHVELLTELGKTAEAAAAACEYLAIFAREGLFVRGARLDVAAACALGRAGEHDRALQLIEDALSAARRIGQSGLALGELYEARARLAIWMGDRPAFERAAERCDAEYHEAQNPALAARLDRLFEEARQRELITALPPPSPEHLALLSQYTHSEYATLHSRLLECVDGYDRARCALTILLQHSDCFAGYLYGIDERGVELLASLPEGPPDEALTAWVEAYVDAELTAAVTATAGGQSEERSEAPVPARYATLDGVWDVVLLLSTFEGEQRAVAALVRRVEPGPRTPLSRGLLVQIAEQLLAQGDVRGAALSVVEPRTV